MRRQNHVSAAAAVAALLCGQLASVWSAVKISDASDAGQAAFKIETATATYYYHKKGCGFSSVVDRDGNDWVGFEPVSGSRGKGEYRGIPNFASFHPGYNVGSTTIKSQNSECVILESSASGFTCSWEIYDTHVHMTLQQAKGAYWWQC